jgi:hypothetical protein
MSALTYGGAFERELQKLIIAEINAAGDTIVSGNVEDFSRYQRLVGMVAGLRLAIKLCEDANDKLSER